MDAGEPSGRRRPLDLLGGGYADVEIFWARVRRNLEAGRVRMVFVADEIPREVRWVVEFLNDQMSPAEVLAIEVKQFVDAVHGMRTLVPRLLGQSVKAQERKVDPGVRRAKRTWTEDEVLAEIRTRHGTKARAATQRVIRWAQREGLREGFIGGPKQGSVYYEVAGQPEPARFLFVHSRGVIGFGFGRLKAVETFESQEARREVADLLERIEGFEVKNVDGGPELPLALLSSDAAFERLAEAVRFVVRRTAAEMPED